MYKLKQRYVEWYNGIPNVTNWAISSSKVVLQAACYAEEKYIEHKIFAFI